MTDIETMRRLKGDGIYEHTAPGRVAAKVIAFPEHVSRLISDEERRYRAKARRAVTAGILLFWGLMTLMVWAWR